MPCSVMIAVTSSAGVTSNAGLRAGTPGAETAASCTDLEKGVNNRRRPACGRPRPGVTGSNCEIRYVEGMTSYGSERLAATEIREAAGDVNSLRAAEAYDPHPAFPWWSGDGANGIVQPAAHVTSSFSRTSRPWLLRLILPSF